MKKRTYRTFCADFETTVYKGQEFTEVWAAALVELGTEDVRITDSIQAFFAPVFEMLKKENVKLYFHNLKFDGSFIMDYFLRDLKLSQAYYEEKPGDKFTTKWYKDSAMLNNTFKYMITDMGQWYMIQAKIHNHWLMIVDSFKLLPFALAAIGKSFGTKHQKLTMEYEGIRCAGGVITPEEREYIKNDVLVMKEALEIMFSEGHTKLTIGSCCMEEYRRIMGYDFKGFFPDMSAVILDKAKYGSENADSYIRKAYRGGWCYVVKGKEGRTFTDGITLDVNSLYPSVMSKESGNEYPYGDPVFWKGDYIPDQAQKEHRYFFIRFKSRFQLKKGKLPTVQIKSSALYKKNEYLESSRIRIHGELFSYVKLGNKVITDQVTMTLTCTDYKLFLEHYDVWDMEILDGCWFYTHPSLFDNYIEKYRKIKQESTGAIRTLAKLYLNNLYGKMATGTDSSFKIAYVKEDETIGFYTIPEYEKKLIYIPAGAAVTAYARDFTIRAAQANFYGAYKPGFIYADTDSIHCDIPLEKVRNVRLHDTDFLAWKCEAHWKKAVFLRQKTYIETDEETSVTACGMGKRCKELIAGAIDGTGPEAKNEDERRFLETFRGMQDFKIGLIVPSNLKQKRIKGGVVLMEDYFQIR